MPGASNLAILMFQVRHAFSISGILKVAAHNFMKSRSRDGLAAKGLLVVLNEISLREFEIAIKLMNVEFSVDY